MELVCRRHIARLRGSGTGRRGVPAKRIPGRIRRLCRTSAPLLPALIRMARRGGNGRQAATDLAHVRRGQPIFVIDPGSRCAGDLAMAARRAGFGRSALTHGPCVALAGPDFALGAFEPAQQTRTNLAAQAAPHRTRLHQVEAAAARTALEQCHLLDRSLKQEQETRA